MYTVNKNKDHIDWSIRAKWRNKLLLLLLLLFLCACQWVTETICLIAFMGNGIQMNYWKQTCHNNWELQNISYFFQKQFCSKVIESVSQQLGVTKHFIFLSNSFVQRLLKAIQYISKATFMSMLSWKNNHMKVWFFIYGDVIGFLILWQN